MNIAILGNIPLPIKQDTPAGTEVFTANLIKGLKDKGHTITLYATKNDTTDEIRGYFTEKEIKNEQNLISDPKFQKLLYSYQNLLLKDIIKDSANYDVVHNNWYLTSLVFPFSSFFKSPVVHTVHNDLFELTPFASFADLTLTDNDTLVYVSSNAHKKSKIQNKRSQYIHNAIDNASFTFNPEGGESMIWFGRISPNKGLREAIEATNKLNRPLQILLNDIEVRYKDYFENDVKSKIQDSKSIQFIQRSDFNSKVTFIGKSKLFLFPLQWEEPFGLVLIESMATGTPVVTFARGAIPEIVKDGETGFIVNPSDADIRGDWIIKKTGLDGIAEAVERIYSMNPEEYKLMRSNCRTHVQNNFSLQIMTRKYEELYSRIISQHHAD